MGMGLGPIPWLAIKTYTDLLGYEEDIKDLILKVVMAFDTVFVKKENEKLEKKMPKTPPPKPPLRRK